MNIHVEPVAVRTDIGLDVADELSIGISEAVTIEIREGDRVVGHHHSISPAIPHGADATPRPARIFPIYRFTDWNGPEEVFVLCRRYLDDLHTIVEDSRKSRFLT